MSVFKPCLAVGDILSLSLLRGQWSIGKELPNRDESTRSLQGALLKAKNSYPDGTIRSHSKQRTGIHMPCMGAKIRQIALRDIGLLAMLAGMQQFRDLGPHSVTARACVQATEGSSNSLWESPAFSTCMT